MIAAVQRAMASDFFYQFRRDPVAVGSTLVLLVFVAWRCWRR